MHDVRTLGDQTVWSEAMHWVFIEMDQIQAFEWWMNEKKNSEKSMFPNHNCVAISNWLDEMSRHCIFMTLLLRIIEGGCFFFIQFSFNQVEYVHIMGCAGVVHNGVEIVQ